MGQEYHNLQPQITMINYSNYHSPSSSPHPLFASASSSVFPLTFPDDGGSFAEDFETILSYLYTGTLNVGSQEEAARLAAAARFLQLEEEEGAECLAEMCAGLIAKGMDSCDAESLLDAW